MSDLPRHNRATADVSAPAAPAEPSVAPAVPGLTSTAAAELLALHGPNTVTRSPQRPVWRRILTALREPLVLVLLAAAVLTTITGDVPDTLVIGLVVIVNTFVAVWQEVRAQKAVSALSQLAAPVAEVVRDSHEQLVPAADLVPGDVVVLGEGDVVPADGYVIEAASLRVDEAALTGESVAVDKSVSAFRRVPVEAEDRPRQSMVFAGTTLVHGRARVVLTETGDDSTLGRIARLLEVPRVATPMQRRMTQLSTTLAVVVVALCVGVLGLGLLRGQPFELMLLTGVSLAVAAVPESLPVVVTMSLALAARRMAQRHAIVRNLTAVETLGSVTLLATDKTGTLTEGRMSVDNVLCAAGVEPAELLRAALLCNDARLAHDTGDAHMGDPTEVALLLAAREHGLERSQVEAELPRIAEVPFDSVSKWMSTDHRLPDGQTLTIAKGAPEVLLGEGLLVSGPEATEALECARAMAEAGHRVLAVVETTPYAPPRLLGLLALHDPPRPAARRTIADCREAGIRPVLITGDHAATAAAIADHVGIGEGRVVDLSALGDVSLAEAVQQQVLARATPEQKLQAVALWQQCGEVVAMTGDGVNDGPALRRADIGVAMGDRGTEVARQAADVVLADDDLDTVVAAVEEGRRVYANVRRFLLYGLSGGAAEILVMLGGPFVGLALPLLPAQILWVNLLTHSLAGTALGAEPVEPGSMKRPPRDPAEGVLGGGLGWRILAVALGLAVVSLLAGTSVSGSDAVIRSAILMALGAGQLGVALGAGVRRARSAEHNPALLWTVTAAAALLVAAVTLPPLQALLGTALIPWQAWLIAVAAGVAGWVVARLITRAPRG